MPACLRQMLGLQCMWAPSPHHAMWPPSLCPPRCEHTWSGNTTRTPSQPACLASLRSVLDLLFRASTPSSSASLRAAARLALYTCSSSGGSRGQEGDFIHKCYRKDLQGLGYRVTRVLKGYSRIGLQGLGLKGIGLQG